LRFAVRHCVVAHLVVCETKVPIIQRVQEVRRNFLLLKSRPDISAPLNSTVSIHPCCMVVNASIQHAELHSVDKLN